MKPTILSTHFFVISSKIAKNKIPSLTPNLGLLKKINQNYKKSIQGAQFFDQGHSMLQKNVEQYVSMGLLRCYFSVDTGYVLRYY
jgi:hypothetical protein